MTKKSIAGAYQFRWRNTDEERPFYNRFGISNEVIGIDKYRIRNIYEYARGAWFLSTDYSSEPVEPPIKWHYLPERPLSKPIRDT